VVVIVRIVKHKTHRACVEYIELIDATFLPERSTSFFIGQVSSDPKVTSLRVFGNLHGGEVKPAAESNSACH